MEIKYSNSYFVLRRQLVKRCFKQIKSGTIRDNGHTYQLYLIIILFDEHFKYSYGATL
jgi:hypothetical protein